MPAYVIITSLQNRDREAYATFNAIIEKLGSGPGMRFSEDAIMVNYGGTLEQLYSIIYEHMHVGDDLAVLAVTGGMGCFALPQTESLFRQTLSGG
jgi:hypothetical protein